MTKTSELSTSKSIIVCSIVLGCFAILWPKIFHPMFFGGAGRPPTDGDPNKPIHNDAFYDCICFRVPI